MEHRNQKLVIFNYQKSSSQHFKNKPKIMVIATYIISYNVLRKRPLKPRKILEKRSYMFNLSNNATLSTIVNYEV